MLVWYTVFIVINGVSIPGQNGVPTTIIGVKLLN